MSNNTKTLFSSLATPPPTGSDHGSGSDAKIFAIGSAIGGGILLIIVIVVLVLQNNKKALKTHFHSVRSRGSKRPLTKPSPSHSPSTIRRAGTLQSATNYPEKILTLNRSTAGSPLHGNTLPRVYVHSRESNLISDDAHMYSNPDQVVPMDESGHVYNDPHCRASQGNDDYADLTTASPSTDGHYAESVVTSEQNSEDDAPYGTAVVIRASSSLTHHASPVHSPKHASPCHTHSGYDLPRLPFQTHIRSSSCGQSAKHNYRGSPAKRSPLATGRALRASSSLSNLSSHSTPREPAPVKPLSGSVKNILMIRESSKEGEELEADTTWYKTSNLIAPAMYQPLIRSEPTLGTEQSQEEQEPKLPRVRVDPTYVHVQIRPSPHLANKGGKKQTPLCSSVSLPMSLPSTSTSNSTSREAVVVNVIHTPLTRFASSEPLPQRPQPLVDTASPLVNIDASNPTRVMARKMSTTDTQEELYGYAVLAPSAEHAQTEPCGDCMEDREYFTLERRESALTASSISSTRSHEREEAVRAALAAPVSDEGYNSTADRDHVYWVLETPPVSPKEANVVDVPV